MNEVSIDLILSGGFNFQSIFKMFTLKIGGVTIDNGSVYIRYHKPNMFFNGVGSTTRLKSRCF